MNPKEKAEELINKFKPLCGGYNGGKINKNFAKQCALIAVEEILSNNCGTNTDGQQAYKEEIYCDEYFWHDVKKEIEKL